MFLFIDKNGVWPMQNIQQIFAEWRSKHLHKISNIIIYILVVSRDDV